ncbi:hypothetical protein AAFF_G00359420 [Aldrovandia affinis]|uniref:Uncharacterized protein n=1 Tax=Aldrovandia affinis TaxID=143900 RepID=A0AAD7SK88_9TELE|nr:hypothetical protein AAFF_G00359420 [Aldrovandia affinis]
MRLGCGGFTVTRGSVRLSRLCSVRFLRRSHEEAVTQQGGLLRDSTPRQTVFTDEARRRATCKSSAAPDDLWTATPGAADRSA